MDKRRWPKEAPVFEVTKGGSRAVKGAIGEMVESFDPGTYNATHPIWGRLHYFGLRVLSGGTWLAGKHPVEGWRGVAIPVEDLRPLTPAARDMLALVKS